MVQIGRLQQLLIELDYLLFPTLTEAASGLVLLRYDELVLILFRSLSIFVVVLLPPFESSRARDALRGLSVVGWAGLVVTAPLLGEPHLLPLRRRDLAFFLQHVVGGRGTALTGDFAEPQLLLYRRLDLEYHLVQQVVAVSFLFQLGLLSGGRLRAARRCLQLLGGVPAVQLS